MDRKGKAGRGYGNGVGQLVSTAVAARESNQ